MPNYFVRVLPLAAEGGVLDEVVLVVTEAELVTWSFGQNYSDYAILDIQPADK